MTQPRIFVTYTPERALARSRSPRAPDHMVAALVGALLAGGATHSAGGVSPQVSATAPAIPLAGVTPRADPARAVQPPRFATLSVTIDPAPPTETRHDSARKTTAAPPPRTPLVSPKRDLAGFLADRGLSLTAEAPLPATGGSERAEAIEIPDQEDRQEAAFAALTIAPELRPGVSPSAPQTASGPASAPAQAPTVISTYPIIEVSGQALGAITMRGNTVHLGSLVGLLELKLGTAEFERLRNAPAVDSFVDLETLRAAGLELAVEDNGERVTLTAL